MPIDTKQPMRPAEQAIIKAINDSKLLDVSFPLKSADIADGQVVTRAIAAGAVTIDKLDTTVQTQMRRLSTLQCGMSDLFTVEANKDTTVPIAIVDIGRVPYVICTPQHANGGLSCTVTTVTRTNITVQVHNGTSANATNATLSWFAI